MDSSTGKISKTLQLAYNDQYTDNMAEWRELGGRYKAKNIEDVCDGQKFTKVLDCGAGEGSILKFLDESNAFADLYALEISDSGIQQIKKRNLGRLRETKKFNGYEIPYPENTFDMAYCSHVIEHVEHPRILLRELKRVSSFQVFEIPLDYSITVDTNVQYFLSYGHINIYTPSLFKFLLRSEGYEILAEKFSSTPSAIKRFNAKNMNWKDVMKIGIYPLYSILKRAIYGKRRFEEYGYSAYTCLAKGVRDLSVF